ncbi:MAG: TIGR02996 domain-containing protein [Myxococcota bacterium]
MAAVSADRADEALRRFPPWLSVFSAPGDDAARQVLADALQEAGDPRGEFIALQLQADAPASARRQRTLLRKHLDSWLGPLAPFVIKAGLEFRRGFPATAKLRVDTHDDAARARSLEEWATFEELTFSRETFFAPSMRSLVRAWEVSSAGLLEFGATKALPPLRVVGMELGRWDTQQLRRWEVVARLSSLEVLRVAASGLTETTLVQLFGALPPRLASLSFVDERLTRAEAERALARAPATLRQLVTSDATWTRAEDGWSGRGPLFA